MGPAAPVAPRTPFVPDLDVLQHLCAPK